MRDSNPAPISRASQSVLLGVLWCMTMPFAVAQQASDQLSQSLARAQSLLRQVAQEKSLLEADIATLRAENTKTAKLLSGTEAKLDDSAAGLGAAQRDVATLRSKIERADKRFEKTMQQLRDVVAKYKAQAKALQETTNERDELTTRLQETAAELADSERKNLALYAANVELLQKLGAGNSWTALLRNELVTGIKQVEIENIVQDYEHKLHDNLRQTNVDAVVE